MRQGKAPSGVQKGFDYFVVYVDAWELEVTSNQNRIYNIIHHLAAASMSSCEQMFPCMPRVKFKSSLLRRQSPQSGVMKKIQTISYSTDLIFCHDINKSSSKNIGGGGGAWTWALHIFTYPPLPFSNFEKLKITNSTVSQKEIPRRAIGALVHKDKRTMNQHEVQHGKL